MAFLEIRQFQVQFVQKTKDNVNMLANDNRIQEIN